MDPVGATVGGLFDELVEVAVVHDPGEPSVEDLHVGVMSTIGCNEVIDRNVYVGSLSRLVLAVRHSSYEGVEFGATIAGTDDDRDIEVLT